MNGRVCAYCRTPINMLRATARFCSAKCRVYSTRIKVPAALAGRDRWIRWRYDIRDGRAVRIPMKLSGGPASCSDERTWTTYAAVMQSQLGDGAAFVLNGDGLACVDINDCLGDGKPTEAAARLLERLSGAWVEISPSGTGLHVWGRAARQPGRRLNLDGLNVQCYTTGKYITITGRTFCEGDLSTPVLHWL